MLQNEQELQETFINTVVENLEKKHYLKPQFNSVFKNEVKSKIEEFSRWFNSTARLCLLKCNRIESEIYVYLLLNLKKKLQFAISEINKSVSKRRQSYICSVCDEKIEVQPWQSVWDKIQDHPHLEECYCKVFDKAPNTLISTLQDDESSVNNSVVDLSEESNQVTVPESKDAEKSQDSGVDDLTFNFEVAYDERIEKTIYPESLVRVAQNADHLSDYTVQRQDIDRAVCLLCPCSLFGKGKKGKISKMNPFVIKNHVNGRKHLKNASTEANQSALKKYHEFWRRQDAIYQAHQVYFIPEISALDRCKCQLCQQPILYDGVINHIKTNKLHKIRVLNFFHSPREKLNEFSLLDVQVKTYNDTKKEKKQKKVSNRAARQKCVFVKFVPNPNQVNLPPRYKGHSKFLTRKVNLVSCRICKESVYNNSTVIRRHIQSDQHKLLSGTPLQNYNFFCDICKIHVGDEDAWDDHVAKGSKNHSNVSQGGKIKVAEYECSTCNVVIYGDPSSLNRHISSRRSKENIREMKIQDKGRKRKAEMELAQMSAFFLPSLEKKMTLQNQAPQNRDCQQAEMELSQVLSAPFPPIPWLNVETTLQNKATQDANLKQNTEINVAQSSSDALSSREKETTSRTYFDESDANSDQDSDPDPYADADLSSAYSFADSDSDPDSD